MTVLQNAINRYTDELILALEYLQIILVYIYNITKYFRIIIMIIYYDIFTI